MHFDDFFFEGEVRQGFYIRPMMKRVWAVELEIVNVVAKICARHDIKWFADSGTMLGAVREKGYIPWDDDIDLGMLRTDYERFLAVAPKELPEGWFIRNSVNDPNPNSMTLNIYNSDTIRLDDEFLDRYHGCPYGVAIDICPYDNIPNAPDEEHVFHLIATMVCDCFITAGSGLLFENSDDEIKERVLLIEENVGFHFNRSLPLKPQALRLADSISAMYADEDADKVACIEFYSPNINNKKPKAAYDSVIMMPFENIMIPVPAGYDSILRVSYGDSYMTPMQASASHNYPNFAGEEKKLKVFFEEQNLDFPKIFE